MWKVWVYFETISNLRRGLTDFLLHFFFRFYYYTSFIY